MRSIIIVFLISRSSHPEVFLGKAVLQSNFIEIALLQSNFIEIALLYGCSPVNLLHIFRTPFPKNTSERVLLHFVFHISISPERPHITLDKTQINRYNYQELLNILILLYIFRTLFLKNTSEGLLLAIKNMDNFMHIILHIRKTKMTVKQILEKF